jgi:non-specific serine/threonine protein kinase
MGLVESQNLQHFYISEEQSFYLLSHADARKLKDWLSLCESQLASLGFTHIELLGNGAYGFVFAGNDANQNPYVFKFARITLPQHIQDRLEEESFMLSRTSHPGIPKFIEFQNISGQSILMMTRAKGINLEQLSRQTGKLAPDLVLKIASQMADILLSLRGDQDQLDSPTMVHGDIKPSNIMFDPETQTVSLIDWGAAVFAQCDAKGHRIDGIGHNAFQIDVDQTNAKLGDIYFIGQQQLNGELSSPRFDEQGLAGTLYALASGQGSRFGSQVITPQSLGLPIEFANTLAAMLDEDRDLSYKAGDYFLKNMPYMKRIQARSTNNNDAKAIIPYSLVQSAEPLETVVYSSRKGFLRQEMGHDRFIAQGADYGGHEGYKNYLAGMGDTEKAFVIAVSHLGRFPLVGGLAIRWEKQGVSIDSSLNLYQTELSPNLSRSFASAINNVVHLGRAINKQGVFKSCIFDARKTLHIGRDNVDQAFVADPEMQIPFEIQAEPALSTDLRDLQSPDNSRLHSYFEDGDDPDEMLQLPEEIMRLLASMNRIRHTGCIIFEAVEKDLKIHNYLSLLDASKEAEFRYCLDSILTQLDLIDGLGVSGFMKLPYKNTKFFDHCAKQPDQFC